MINLRLISDGILHFPNVTSLSEQGVYLRNIETFLGYRKTKTLEIYTQVIKKSHANFKRPLDHLTEGQNILNQHIKAEKNK